MKNDNRKSEKLLCRRALSIWNIEILTSNFVLNYAGILVNGFVISAYLVNVLKASPQFIGLIAGATMFQGCLQPFSAMLVQKIKNRKVFSATCIFVARIIFLSGLVYGLFASSSGKVMFPLIAFLCFLGATIQSLSVEINSWLVDITEESDRGKRLAIRNAFTNIGAMLGVFSAGLVLRYTNDKLGFMILFGSSLIIFIISYIVILCVYDPGKKETGSIPMRASLIEVLKDKNFMSFIFVVAVSNLAVYVTMPFFNPFYISYFHIPYDMLGILNTATTLMLALGFYFWGRMMSVFGSRLLLKISMFLLVIIPLLWFFVPPGNYTLPCVLIAFSYSFIQGGWTISHVSVAFTMNSRANNLAYISVYSAVVAIFALIGPNLGGLLVSVYTHTEAISSRLSLPSPYMITFIISACVNMFGIILYPSFKAARERGDLRLRDMLVRPDAINVFYKLTMAVFVPNLIVHRKKFALEMGNIKTTVALPTLISLLDDLDQNVRLSAIEAIGQIHYSEARDILINYSAEANILEQEALLRALGNFHDEVTEAFLLKMYTSKYLVPRIASANALSKFKSERAKDIALWRIATQKYNENEFMPHLAVLSVNMTYEAIPYIVKHYKNMRVLRHKEETLYYLATLFGVEKDYYREHSKGGEASLKKHIHKMFEKIENIETVHFDKKLRIKIDEIRKKILSAISNSDELSFTKDYKIIYSLIENRAIKEKLEVFKYFIPKKSLSIDEMKFVCMAFRSVL